MNSHIKDINLADKGKMRMDWVARNMPVLGLIGKRFEREKPLKNIRISACLHITAETANLFLALRAGGADVLGCASNPLSTQDDVAAALVKYFDIPIFAIKGEDTKTYYDHIQAALDFGPNITMDDGADLVYAMHKKFKFHPPTGGSNFVIDNRNGKKWEFLGSSEETTTGVIRLKAMEKDGVLKIPVMAVNDSDTKHLFDNRYGTGQSTVDGIIRATDILLAGKKFVVVGYGWCGRGLAGRARGMGANVTVVEIDPVRALEAVMEGYEVNSIDEAVKKADVVVTVTGGKHSVSLPNMKNAKNGVIIANSGHFNVEIDYEGLKKTAKARKVRDYVEEFTFKNGKKVYILGEGRLINLVAATGHPAEVMDMSFANQALAAEWFAKHKRSLDPQVYRIPKEMDKEIARLKLVSMGITTGKLTSEQEKYLGSWQEGT